ncbi:MAG: hypothetical protein EOM50_02930 [Erysipelotrichia bacterium]|nr:hypothetical protein [Erysipelotrichia bacterium]
MKEEGKLVAVNKRKKDELFWLVGDLRKGPNHDYLVVRAEGFVTNKVVFGIISNQMPLQRGDIIEEIPFPDNIQEILKEWNEKPRYTIRTMFKKIESKQKLFHDLRKDLS